MKQIDKKALGQKILYLIIMVVIVVADRVSKHLAVLHLENADGPVTVIPGVLDFTFLRNTGAVAGMMSERRLALMLFSAAGVIVAFLILMLSTKLGTGAGVTLAMVVAGGIGNMIDRIFEGSVVDFIFVTAVNFFPFNCVFNVADIAITVGAALLFVILLFEIVKESKEEKKQKASQQLSDGESSEETKTAGSENAEGTTDTESKGSEDSEDKDSEA